MDSSDDERFHHFFEAESEDAMAPVHKLRNTDTSNADSSNLPKAFARPSSTQPPPLRSRLPEVAHDQDVLITMESQNMLLGSTPVASSPPLAPRSRVVPRATVGSSVSTALGGSTFIDPVQTTSGGGSEIDLEKYDNQEDQPKSKRGERRMVPYDMKTEKRRAKQALTTRFNQCKSMIHQIEHTHPDTMALTIILPPRGFGQQMVAYSNQVLKH